MARKDVLQYQLASAQSMAASFTSKPTFVKFADNISYQINITTSNSTGTFAVQVSDDYNENQNGNVLNPGNWVALSLGGGTPTANGANDNILISLNQVPSYAIRLVYTPIVAGTGTMDVWITTKQIGG